MGYLNEKHVAFKLDTGLSFSIPDNMHALVKLTDKYQKYVLMKSVFKNGEALILSAIKKRKKSTDNYCYDENYKSLVSDDKIYFGDGIVAIEFVMPFKLSNKNNEPRPLFITHQTNKKRTEQQGPVDRIRRCSIHHTLLPHRR